jgi:large subunit ribosomal protein L24
LQKKPKRHVKKNDLVLVLSGKDKGKRGVVLDVIPKKSRAIVEGIHMIKKHMRPSPQAPQGGIIEREGTIHISNLKVVCPKTNRPSRIKRQVIEKQAGNRTKKYRQRVAVKSGEIVDRN